MYVLESVSHAMLQPMLAQLSRKAAKCIRQWKSILKLKNECEYKKP